MKYNAGVTIDPATENGKTRITIGRENGVMIYIERLTTKKGEEGEHEWKMEGSIDLPTPLALLLAEAVKTFALNPHTEDS